MTHASWSWSRCIALLESEFGNPDSSLIMPDFDLSGELSLKIELHMLRPITEKVSQWQWASFVSVGISEGYVTSV